MRPLLLALSILLVISPVSVRGLEPTAVISRPAITPVLQAKLHDFSRADYDAAVEALFARYETGSRRRIAPGKKGRVGLKIYTDSGPGMATPIALTQAVVSALVRRGYLEKNIFLVGLNQMRLRMTGYLPALGTGAFLFPANKVYVLESSRYYDPVWYYDSPLPQRFDPILALHQVEGVSSTSTRDEDRKSFLATPLFLDADFWINLPAYTDHQTLGINGSLVNATLWNASNTARFFRSPATAPAAVAEMSAIPELRQTWKFTITSLEHYQFIGGPFFNSLYTRSEPIVWLSTDPVMLDALMRARINNWRRETGFDPIPDEIRTLEYAETLGVGSTRIADVRIIPVN